MKRKYDDEFKRNIMWKILDGQPVRSISQEPGVNEGLIHTAVGKKSFCKTATAFKVQMN
jgi:transposase-like protein